MRRVIDLECDLPPDEHGVAAQGGHAGASAGATATRSACRRWRATGSTNYRTIFTRPCAARRWRSGAARRVAGRLRRRAGPGGGGQGCDPGGRTACWPKSLRQYPDRFIGMANLSPHDGMRGVREFERLVRDCGLGGLRVSSLYTMIPASDRRYYPLYAKCAELDLPLRIYTAMNYANDRPYDLGHPRHLDQVAMDFPELRIVAGLGGWPWVNEMVALLRRHPRLYADTGSHRPRHFATPGSGWEQFLAVRQHDAAGQ